MMTPEFMDYAAAIERRANCKGCARVKAEGTFATCNTCGGVNDCLIIQEFRVLTHEMDLARARLERARLAEYQADYRKQHPKGAAQ